MLFKLGHNNKNAAILSGQRRTEESGSEPQVLAWGNLGDEGQSSWAKISCPNFLSLMSWGYMIVELFRFMHCLFTLSAAVSDRSWPLYVVMKEPTGISLRAITPQPLLATNNNHVTVACFQTTKTRMTSHSAKIRIVLSKFLVEWTVFTGRGLRDNPRTQQQ